MFASGKGAEHRIYVQLELELNNSWASGGFRKPGIPPVFHKGTSQRRDGDISMLIFELFKSKFIFDLINPSVTG